MALSARGLLGQEKPNSRIRGLQIAMMSGSLPGMTAGDIIPAMLKIGLSEVELADPRSSSAFEEGKV